MIVQYKRIPSLGGASCATGTCGSRDTVLIAVAACILTQKVLRTRTNARGALVRLARLAPHAVQDAAVGVLITVGVHHWEDVELDSVQE